ncbi:MAG: S8 family serine peptidase [Candidatus Thiodiazotropha sp. (ex Dulcina madagascariensis)]|nr:S8 family serine peptidase [Candidatus Thiodiazotropha sp. (ex Dulcina madagascariensis)]
MQKRLFTVMLWGILIFHFPTVFAAAVLTADVDRLVAQANRTSRIPVIVKFKKQININTFRDKLRQQNQYKSTLDRKNIQLKKQFRSKLLKRLKAQIAQPQARLSALLRRHEVKTRLTPLWSINAIALELPAHLVDEIAALPEVERLTVDMRLSMNTTPAETVSSEPLWNLDNLGTARLWQQGVTGEGVVVGIMDSGVDLNHPDLADRWRGGINSWFDPYGQHEIPADLVGHGTQALGLILGGDDSGYQIGIAPEATWIAARIFDDANQTTLSAIHQAFQWLLDPDGDPLTDDAPDLVNNSWGFANTVNQCYQEFSDDIQLLREAGIGVVFAAGNFGPFSESSISPANNPGALSVGSVDQFNAIEFLSSRGPGACDGGVFPKLVAPGSLVFTTDLLPAAYNVVSGTSFAAPHVTGAMALLKSAFPEATVSQIETAMYDSAIDLGETGADDRFGYGILDVAAAYDLLLADFASSETSLLGFSEPAYSVDEETARLVVSVRRLQGSRGEVSVDYHTTDDEARSGRDYTASSGTLTFSDGETLRSFEIPIRDDRLDEANESFYLTLSNVRGNATLSNQSEVEATILDNDGRGVFSFGAISYAVNESREEAIVNVLRTGGTAGEVEIAYRVIGDSAIAGLDFIADEGEIRFYPGETEKQILIELLDDRLYEGNERFQLLLSATDDDVEIGDPALTSVTILDNDPDSRVASIHLDAVSYEISESRSAVTVEVVRTGNTEERVSVGYTTLDGSAKHGEDYRESSGSVTFPSGSSRHTLHIEIIDDGEYEQESSFTLQLADAGEGAVVSQPSAAIIRILDDDALPFVSIHSAPGLNQAGQIGAATGAVNPRGGNAPASAGRGTASALQVFDLSLRGYTPGEAEGIRELQTLGGALEPHSQQEDEREGETQAKQSESPCGVDSGHEGGPLFDKCMGTDETLNLPMKDKIDTTDLAGENKMIEKDKSANER